MHLLLSIVGILAAVAGGAMIALLAIHSPVRAVEILIPGAMPGLLAIVGGFTLIGLGAVVAHLKRIANAAEMQPMARASAPAADGRLPESASPAAVPFPPPPGFAKPTAAPSASPSNAGVSAVEAALAGPPSPKPAAPAPPPAPVGDGWPRIEPADRVAPAAAHARGAPAAPPAAQVNGAGNGPEPVRVLKSGVIDGMAYTLYSDGSVDAEMPDGTMHFASISAWRSHLRVGA